MKAPTAKDQKAESAKLRIVNGLTDCIVRKGYAQTKLIDVAEACQTSAPHIRYYFKSKEAILEYNYERLVSQFEDTLKTINELPCGRWLRSLAEQIFSSHPAAQRQLLILMEANLVMARAPHMLALRQRYDRYVLSTMTNKLKALNTLDEKQATNVAQALFDLLRGMMTNAAIDRDFSHSAAISRFCRVAQALTQLPSQEFDL